MVSIAEKIMLEIESKALLIGWTMHQLKELRKTLHIFVPCKVGLVTEQSICIELLHPDGSPRGALSHRNKKFEKLRMNKAITGGNMKNMGG